MGVDVSLIEVDDNSIYILLPKTLLKKLDEITDYITSEDNGFYIIEVSPTSITLLGEITNIILSSITSEGLDNLIQTLLLLKTQGEVSVVRKVFDLSEVYPEFYIEVSVMNRYKIIARLGEFRELLLNIPREEVTEEKLREVLEPIFQAPEKALFEIFVLGNYMFKVKGIVSSKFIKHFPDKLYSLGVYAVPKDKKILQQIKDKLLQNIHILGSVYKEDINFEKVGVYASLVRKGCLESFSLDKYTIVYLPSLESCKIHLNNNERFLLNSIKMIFEEKIRKLSEMTGEPRDKIKTLIYKKFKLL